MESTGERTLSVGRYRVRRDAFLWLGTWELLSVLRLRAAVLLGSCHKDASGLKSLIVAMEILSGQGCEKSGIPRLPQPPRYLNGGCQQKVHTLL